MTQPNDMAKTLLQALAVLGIVLIWLVIVHKGYVDVSALAQKHSGLEFWRALAVYLIRNLSGGGPGMPGSDPGSA